MVIDFKGDSETVKKEIISTCFEAVNAFYRIRKQATRNIRTYINNECTDIKLFADRVIKAVARYILTVDNSYLCDEMLQIWFSMAVAEAGELIKEVALETGSPYSFYIAKNYYRTLDKSKVYLSLYQECRYRYSKAEAIDEKDDFDSIMKFMIAEDVYRIVTGRNYKRSCKNEAMNRMKTVIYRLSQRFATEVGMLDMYLSYEDIDKILNGRYKEDYAMNICKGIEEEVDRYLNAFN